MGQALDAGVARYLRAVNAGRFSSVSLLDCSGERMGNRTGWENWGLVRFGKVEYCMGPGLFGAQGSRPRKAAILESGSALFYIILLAIEVL